MMADLGKIIKTAGHYSPLNVTYSEEIREREWSNVITAHAGSRDVRAWSTLQGALSDKPLSPKLETIVVTV